MDHWPIKAASQGEPASLGAGLLAATARVSGEGGGFLQCWEFIQSL